MNFSQLNKIKKVNECEYNVFACDEEYDYESDYETMENTDYEALNEAFEEAQRQRRQLQDPAKMKFIRESRILPPDDVMWEEYLAVLNAEYNKKQKEIDEENERKRSMRMLKYEQDNAIRFWIKVTSPIKVFIKTLSLPTAEEIRKMNTSIYVASAVKNYFKPIHEAQEKAEKKKAFELLLEYERKRDEEKERLSEEKRILSQKRIQERRQKERNMATQKCNQNTKVQKGVVTGKGLTDEERTKRNAENRKKAKARQEKELDNARQTIQLSKPSNLTVIVFDLDEEEEKEINQSTETTENTTETVDIAQVEKTQEVEYIKTFASILKKKIETDDDLYHQLKIQKELKQQEDSEMAEYIRGLMAVGSIKHIVKKCTHTHSKVEQPKEKKIKKLSLEEFNKIPVKVYSHSHISHSHNSHSHTHSTSSTIYHTTQPQPYIEYQKVCTSIQMGTKCRFGSNCKFVHTFEDLKQVQCKHGLSCGYVQKVNEEYVNKAFGKSGNKCCHIHPNESTSNICKRLGIQQKQQVQPQQIQQQQIQQQQVQPQQIQQQQIQQQQLQQQQKQIHQQQIQQQFQQLQKQIQQQQLQQQQIQHQQQIQQQQLEQQQQIQQQQIQQQQPIQQEYIEYQQVCKSIEMGTVCRFGSRCKFVHTFKDLKQVQCRHNDGCKFVEKVNGEYVNTSFGKSGKKCCHIHPSESVNNICKRLKIKN